MFLHIFFLSIYVHQVNYANIVYTETTGAVGKRIAQFLLGVSSYVSLADENECLKRENERLSNLLKENYTVRYRDSGTDNVHVVVGVKDEEKPLPTFLVNQKFQWVETNVMQKINRVGSSYFVVGAGGMEGIQKGMALVGNNGVAGQIVKVYAHYSLATNLFNVNFSISAKVGKNGSSGILTWDPEDPYYLTLSEIPFTDSVNQGDTIYTSHFSYSFPANIPVGTVRKVIQEGVYYRIELVPTQPLSKLYHVYVLKYVRSKQEEMNMEMLLKEPY